MQFPRFSEWVLGSLLLCCQNLAVIPPKVESEDLILSAYGDESLSFLIAVGVHVIANALLDIDLDDKTAFQVSEGVLCQFDGHKENLHFGVDQDVWFYVGDIDPHDLQQFFLLAFVDVFTFDRVFLGDVVLLDAQEYDAALVVEEPADGLAELLMMALEEGQLVFLVLQHLGLRLMNLLVFKEESPAAQRHHTVGKYCLIFMPIFMIAPLFVFFLRVGCVFVPRALAFPL